MLDIRKHVAPPGDDGFESDEKRFEWLMSLRANYLLLGDKQSKVPMDVINSPQPIVKTSLRWINCGELIAGSFMCNVVHMGGVKHNDVDVYFKDENDAKAFLKLNGGGSVGWRSNIAAQVHFGGTIVNVIYGVHYDTPEDLVSHFDIRACSIAYDPNTQTIHAVKGAFWDVDRKRIVYNPVPHNTSIGRLVKYVEKGFQIDPYQRVFLSELIRGDQYNVDLEISTGYRAVHK